MTLGAWLGYGVETSKGPSASMLIPPNQLGFPLVPGGPSFLQPTNQKPILKC